MRLHACVQVARREHPAACVHARRQSNVWSRPSHAVLTQSSDCICSTLHAPMLSVISEPEPHQSILRWIPRIHDAKPDKSLHRQVPDASLVWFQSKAELTFASPAGSTPVHERGLEVRDPVICSVDAGFGNKSDLGHRGKVAYVQRYPTCDDFICTEVPSLRCVLRTEVLESRKPSVIRVRGPARFRRHLLDVSLSSVTTKTLHSGPHKQNESISPTFPPNPSLGPTLSPPLSTNTKN